jgi:hypothetical protein
MASVAGICNNALIEIGQDTITSLTENSKAARLCNQLYEDVRDAVLRSHPWNCAVTRATLGLLSSTPAWGYAYEYQLPTDPYCLRVLRMDYLDYEFKIEGRKLLTDQGTANILFIFRITDPNQFDKLLIETISGRLASKLAYPLSGSKTLGKEMWKLYESKLVEARGVDAQEGTPDEIEADTWLNERE